jgi:SAM-dependent methyltransferase
VSGAARPCPLCGGAGTRESFPYATGWEGTTFRYLRCGGCGATYVDPVPSEAQLLATYDWATYHDAEYAAVDAERYRHTADVLAGLRAPSGTTVLDFGCGAGGFLAEAARRGFHARGVEVDASVAAGARARSGCRVDVLDDVVAEGARFDVIVLRDVLPHLADPAAALRVLEALLAPGGALFFDGPLEDGASIVRWSAGALKWLRRRLGDDAPAGFAPTMLVRVDAAAQRRFLQERMGYREVHFARYETGWPYHVPGRRPRSTGVAAKEGVALVARAAARVLPLGNRFTGMYVP